MPGRKPTLSRWRKSIAATAALGTVLGFSGIPVHAQETLPKLPATKIEGQPSPTTDPQPSTPGDFPNPNDFPQPGVGGGIPGVGQGGLFASPAADGYRAPSSTTGTIVNVPNISFPGTVSVVPSSLINDQQALRIDDILRDIPGANKLGDFRRPDAFLLRGFEIRSRDYRWNGFLDPTSAPRDFANVQRIEVLQGPASVLYGAGQPSGVVNVITKKPLGQTLGAAEFQFGNLGEVRPSIDVTGPVGDGSLLYRVNAAFEHYDGFRDFYFNERTLAAPAFTLLLSEDTSLTFEGQYLNDRRRLDSGIVQFNGQVGLLPIERYLNQPTTDRQVFNDYKTAIWLTHRFDEGVWGRIGVYAGWWDTPNFGTVPILKGDDPNVGFLQLPPGTLLRQTQDNIAFREQYYSVIGNLATEFCTGPIKHKTLLGTELGWFRSTDFTTRLSDPLTLTQIPVPPFFAPLPTQPINAFAPNYAGTVPPLPGSFNADFIQSRYGLYLQDFMEVTEHFKVLAGVRADIGTNDFGRQLTQFFAGQNIGFPFVQSDATYYRWSPRVGLVYEPVPETVSIYGAYSQSWDLPPGGAFRNPQPLLPETGETWEAGIKADLLDKHLSVTAAGFYTTKNNVVTQDNFFFATQIGQQRAQGLELSAVGRITEPWSILANYSYIDSRIVSDINPLIVGNRFRNVPYNTGNLWTRYNVVQDCDQTIGLALGMTALDARLGDLAGTFNLPGFVRWDAGLFYNRQSIYANLYFENLFDRRYYAGSLDSLSINPGAPFTVRAQVGVRY